MQKRLQEGGAEQVCVCVCGSLVCCSASVDVKG
jgi:hypothetical protein